MATRKEVDKPPAPDVVQEIRAVVTRAKQGDVTALPRLRELLDDCPILWRRYGDLAAQAESAWVTLAAGDDLYMRECLLRQAVAMRAELASSSASPVEKLLVERVVMTWLQAAYFDAIEAQALNADEKPRLAAFRAKRLEQAHRQHLTALAALTTLRKLLPGPAVIAVPSPVEKPLADAVRNGNALAPVNGVHNRLAGYFDEPPASRRNGRRQEALAGIGTAG